MPGLTAKVFRTYNASYTMSTLLKDMKSAGTVPEKVKDYNAANRKVAILCNHKRTVAAGHESQMEKLTDKIKGLKYQKWRVKQMMIDIEPKIKKKKGAEYFELEEDLDEEWIHEHQKFLADELRTKIEKKFAKENEKLKADGEKELKDKELEERLEAVDELTQKFKKENKSGKVQAEGKGASIEKFETNIDKIDQRISTMLVQAEDKEGNKEVALGTSKIVSMLSPRGIILLTCRCRITSILASRWSFPRSSGCQSRNSFPRLYERSSIGRSSRWTKTGNSRPALLTKKVARAGIFGWTKWPLCIARGEFGFCFATTIRMDLVELDGSFESETAG